jgi:hypothetical protein
MPQISYVLKNKCHVAAPARARALSHCFYQKLCVPYVAFLGNLAYTNKTPFFKVLIRVPPCKVILHVVSWPPPLLRFASALWTSWALLAFFLCSLASSISTFLRALSKSCRHVGSKEVYPQIATHGKEGRKNEILTLLQRRNSRATLSPVCDHLVIGSVVPCFRSALTMFAAALA